MIIPENKTKQLVNMGLLLLTVLSLFVLFKFINEAKETRFIGSEFAYQNTISVTGEGEVVAIPDVATFTFTVREEAKDVASAQEVVTREMNAILDLLKENDVEEKDIKTLSYNIYPQYDYIRIQCITYPCEPGREELRGYEVNHAVQVKVRDTEAVGNLLSLVGNEGADNVSGINFSIDDEDTLKADAREQAIEDAEEKAKRLAKDLGVRIVRVASFYEDRGYPGVMYAESRAYGGDAMMDGAVSYPTANIPVGENTIRSTVTITYQIR